MYILLHTRLFYDYFVGHSMLKFLDLEFQQSKNDIPVERNGGPNLGTVHSSDDIATIVLY